MDNFSVIYKILKILEKAMDCEEFEFQQISAEHFGISQCRWAKILEMLTQEGYIQGITVSYSLDKTPLIENRNIRITLKGLEYLSENSFMKKAANAAKEVRDWIPGMR